MVSKKKNKLNRGWGVSQKNENIQTNESGLPADGIRVNFGTAAARSIGFFAFNPGLTNGLHFSGHFIAHTDAFWRWRFIAKRGQPSEQ